MFILSEAIKIISRAKLHFVVNLVSLSISVLLLTISFLLFYSSDAIDRYLQENLYLSVFLQDDIKDDKVEEIFDYLRNSYFTAKVEYISKEKAYEIFIEETGEDFKKILEFNPLPASFNLFLKVDYANRDSIKSIVSKLSNVAGVTEVNSKMDFLERIIFVTDKIKTYLAIVSVLMTLVSIYLVFSTNKLIINSNSEQYETMKLVGAKLSTIKMPIVLNNFFVGLISGLISIGFMGLFINFLELNLQSILDYLRLNQNLVVGSIILFGPLLGVFVSLLSLSKVTLKIKS
jgi:cell division transport system permease protein